MAYTTTVSGITVTSNVDTSVSQPSGSTYSHTITFAAPFVNALAQAGVNFIDYVDNNYIAQQFAGAGHTVTNVKATCPNDNTLIISYVASSPTIIEAVTLIIGIVLFIIGTITTGAGGALATLLIFLGAASLVISTIYTQVVAPVISAITGAFNTPAGKIIVYGAIALAVVGLAFVTCGMVKSGKTTQYAVGASEGAAKVAGKTLMLVGG